MFRNKAGELLRQINAVYEPHYGQLMKSGLYDALVGEGWLVEHEEANLDERLTEDGRVVIRPRAVPFVSYPYEWCFGQLRDAALLTLDIQRCALRHGMSLKDSSAYNVQFIGPRPVFIDTLSFEPHKPGRPWVGYRQFCRHFLAPLALMSLVDVRSNTLLRAHIDGVPLDLAARLLPKRSCLRGGLLLHLHLHAKAETRHAQAGVTVAAPEGSMSERGLQGILDSLEKAVRKLNEPPMATHWRDYYATSTYTDESTEEKKQVVAAFLDTIGPLSVWDLGANTGLYSELAAETGATVVAVDQDPACIAACYENWKERAVNICPLVMDLSNPSPALGWAHGERQSLAQRGPADAVLALALIHHLAIGNNVPLPDAASYLRALCRHLIIEFVPKEDTMVQHMLASREDVFSDYHREGFETAFGQHFTIHETRPSQSSSRILYRMEAL